MKIYIEDLKFQAIIGILDFERTTPQEVVVNLEITYNFREHFINYAEVATLITTTMQESKFLLIEDALSNLSHQLKNKFTTINRLKLKITKPDIMPNCRVSVEDFYDFVS